MDLSKKRNDNLSARKKSSSNTANLSSSSLSLYPPNITNTLQFKPASNKNLSKERANKLSAKKKPKFKPASSTHLSKKKNNKLSTKNISKLAKTQQTPAEITQNYQVKKDEMEVWSPKLFGGIPLPFTPSQLLTKTEGNLLDKLTFERGFLGLSEFKDIKNEAFKTSSTRYPIPEDMPDYVPEKEQNAWAQNLGHQDAFRHAYWNALLTREFGEKWTREFTTAHEGIPGNDAEMEAMDLYNNEIGRNIATTNPDATDEEIADLIQQAITDGQLTVVDRQDNLAMSNNVDLWDHGRLNVNVLPGQIDVPAGTASVE